jgi:hypothetical protein
MITQRGLEKLGYKRFSWNNGAIVEHWKSIAADGSFDARIGVRFGEFRNEPYVVWLIFPYYMFPVRHLRTLNEIEQLWKLLSGKQGKAIDPQEIRE